MSKKIEKIESQRMSMEGGFTLLSRKINEIIDSLSHDTEKHKKEGFCGEIVGYCGNKKGNCPIHDTEECCCSCYRCNRTFVPPHLRDFCDCHKKSTPSASISGTKTGNGTHVKDTKERQTHSFNDGCGDPAHNNTLKEEFMNHPELAGTNGYCNPVFAEKIADWFIQKFSAHDTELVEGIKEMKVIELQKPKNGEEALRKAMDWARNETIDAVITYIEDNKIQ